MATPRSAERSTEAWTAVAHMYSGRTEPSWAVPADAAAHLLKIWAALAHHQGPAPSPPPLGYRGCSLRTGGGIEWFAYGGVVTRTKNGAIDARRDAARAFELRALESAPQRLLPESVLKSLRQEKKP